MSALEKTICSFSSKNTKDNFRKLLVSFGNAIVEVIKERQSEVTVSQGTSTSNDYDAGSNTENFYTVFIANFDLWIEELVIFYAELFILQLESEL